MMGCSLSLNMRWGGEYGRGLVFRRVRRLCVCRWAGAGQPTNDQDGSARSEYSVYQAEGPAAEPRKWGPTTRCPFCPRQQPCLANVKGL